MTPEQDPISQLVQDIRPHLHGDGVPDRITAARMVAARLGQTPPLGERESLTVLNEFLALLLAYDRDTDAAALLWPDHMVDVRPECARVIWNAYPTESLLALQGASSCGKSYTPCVRLMLDWLRDPEWTSIICIGPKEAHLQNNVFSTLVRLHQASVLPLPGELGDLFIGTSRRDSFGGFKGLVIPRSAKGVVIQGMTKAQKRTGPPHPKYGTQGRVRVYIDEIEDCPPLIHQDLNNTMSGIDKSNPDRLKIIVSYNPKYSNGPVAAMVEPKKGWTSFDIENDHDWVSKRGWRVLRLDAHRSENVITGENIYGGIQTRDALDALRDNSGGEDTAGYQTFGRGAFPRSVSSTAAVPQKWLDDAKGFVTWATPPTTHIGGDLALGGDATALCQADFGYISTRSWMGYESDPTRTLVYPRPRPCIYLRKIHQVIGHETTDLANAIRAVCIAALARPETSNFDPGGPGMGVVDVVRRVWDSGVRSTWAAGSPTDKRVMEEDKLPANEVFRYAVDEMWYAVRKYLEYGFIVIDPSIPSASLERLFNELTGRLWTDQSMTKLEPKLAYKKRNGGRSPDFADALCLLVHGVRLEQSFRPSIADGSRSPKEATSGRQAMSQPALNAPPPGAIIFGDPEETLRRALSGERHANDDGYGNFLGDPNQLDTL